LTEFIKSVKFALGVFMTVVSYPIGVWALMVTLLDRMGHTKEDCPITRAITEDLIRETGKEINDIIREMNHCDFDSELEINLEPTQVEIVRTFYKNRIVKIATWVPRIESQTSVGAK